MSLERKDSQQGGSAHTPDQIAQALEKVADAINRLADAYLYVNQKEDEAAFEGQSLSDRESL